MSDGQSENLNTLLNYVFRKTGVKVRIYAAGIGEYSGILSDFPDHMKKDIIKAGDCKKLSGLKCTPTCTGGYAFRMDDTDYKKCKNMAFFHSLMAFAICQNNAKQKQKRPHSETVISRKWS